ncbi:beta-1,3-galactosyltransferase 1-like [Tubulanus polymorphus]|uniref:beta-1,3-galactosyltransferase 1-like n=1 Tax=Tubulanus polymorphus TaxID=672921 RepID=UPI003DA5EA17
MDIYFMRQCSPSKLSRKFISKNRDEATSDILTTEKSASSNETTTENERPMPTVPSVKITKQQPNIFSVENMTEKEYYKLNAAIVNPHDFNYRIQTPICNSNNPPYLLIFVLSRPAARDVRDSIRKTWGSVATGQPNRWPNNRTISKTVSLFFLLGITDNKEYETQLRSENAQYNDLIQEDFYDSYVNLTLKSIMALKLARNCSGARFLMKCDDDMFVNIHDLMKYLETKEKQLNNSIVGHILSGGPVMRIGKWAVPKSSFPFSKYPRYVSGNAYVMSLEVASILYDVSLHVAIFNIEDAYITGVCAKIAKIQLVFHKGFTNIGGTRATKCEIVNGTKITATRYKPRDLMQIWKALLSSYKC